MNIATMENRLERTWKMFMETGFCIGVCIGRGLLLGAHSRVKSLYFLPFPQLALFSNYVSPYCYP